MSRTFAVKETISMIDKRLILSLTDQGLEVFRHYLPPFVPRKNFRNPLYDDHKASCNVFFDKRNSCWRMHDFGDPRYSGDCFWLVSRIYGYDLRSDFVQVMKQISHDLSLGLYDDDEVILRQALVEISKEEKDHTDTSSATTGVLKPRPFCYSTLAWDKTTLRYWGSYGITQEVLERYGVLAIDDFSSYSRSGRFYTICGDEETPIYAYNLGSGLKLYRPLGGGLKFMYAGRVLKPYIFGLSQLPEEGDLLIITGGEKDVLTLASRGYSAICFNSETKSVGDEIISKLASRFAHIVVLYDMDETGIRSSKAMVERHSTYDLKRLELPLSGKKSNKDISDFFRNGGKEDDLRMIIQSTLQV